MPQVIALPRGAQQPVNNPRWRGRYPACVVPAWKVNQRREKRASDAATLCEYEAASRRAHCREVLEALDELRRCAVEGLIEGLSYVVQLSADDVRAGAAGSYCGPDDAATRANMADAFQWALNALDAG